MEPGNQEQADTEFDAVVVGAGFGGLYMLYKLREMGLRVKLIEAGTNVGGTWYWNRYPGARCDVESLVYCYSFSPELDAEWRWTEKYAAQPEILRYINFAADRLDLRKDILFNTRVTAAQFNESGNRWQVTTGDGGGFRASHLIAATGPISEPVWPDIPNRAAYHGDLYHTARWPRDGEPDFSGKRVAVIGTGSSGTQLVPLIAKQAKELAVYVRTPSFYAPANNKPLSVEDYAQWEEVRSVVRARQRRNEFVGAGDIFMEEELHEVRRCPGGLLAPAERREILERRWGHGGAAIPRAFADVAIAQDINDEVSDFMRDKMRELIGNAELEKVLIPHDLMVGTKRVTVGTDYFEAFKQDNVSAISVKATPIERFTAKGMIVGGEEREFDVIIAASGFDALTGALTAIDIRGPDGQSIKEAWAEGPQTYIGMGVAGFPNFYMIGGPGSPTVLANVVLANEIQVDWVAGLIDHMRQHHLARVEVEPEAQRKWTQTVNDAIKGTVMERANSWYVGANVPGKPRAILAYAGGLDRYIDICDEVAEQGYTGFHFTG